MAALGLVPKTLRRCAIAGCGRTAIARGLCPSCYARARRNEILPERERGRRFTSHLHFVMDEDISSQLRQASRQTGKSYAQLTREALEHYLGIGR